MRYVYKNRYGRLEIEISGSYQNVSLMKSKEFDLNTSFNISEAEKIALITGNNGIQLVFAAWDRSKVFLLHHESSSRAALCKVIKIEFSKDIDAQKELDRPNPYRGAY